MVVCPGVTLALVPRTAPSCGLTIKYDAPLTIQLNVAEPVEFVVVGLAENEEITGAFPLGTVADV